MSNLLDLSLRLILGVWSLVCLMQVFKSYRTSISVAASLKPGTGSKLGKGTKLKVAQPADFLHQIDSGAKVSFQVECQIIWWIEDILEGE